MTKLFVSLPFVLALCGSAFAGGTPPGAAPQAPTYRIGLAITSGKQVRRYAVKLVDHTCGGIEARSPVAHDRVHLCTYTDGNAIRLEVDWSLDEGNHEIKNKSAAHVTRGATFDLDGGTAKLAVTIR